MVYRLCVILLLSTLALSSCKSKKRTVTSKKKTRTERVVIHDKKQEKTIVLPEKTEIKQPPANASYTEIVATYIDNYSKIAMEEMLQYGIPASITLAQGILESGAGRGDLTKKANNHFGIKCHDWTGDRVYHDDDELQECFRKYKDPKYSFRDHSLFLTERSRYQDLFKLKKHDYKGWARGLKKAGYATDPRYPDKLISIIERYNLRQYDTMVLGDQVTLIEEPNSNKIESYTVKRGDTLYSISRRFNITVDTLKEYNGLTSNTISIGQVLYLHSVKNQ
ncbi:glucosaminidase domain-containing protein [Marixanthomonas sp. SCSIO 43207]|uniref:glucosaminidase domain-containing protein n=1 Tax=Marixanthomonas sp. SCSIO 43207 TaxID=2779360 RepID=UPI001CA943C4|nr:glucosaminidase domain-containing protein [Marixanthomonas sp. SCSIO 43207]UAB82459.1 glucosaminidase domain-containing protein [Marixanthomonas sp. SCSIO 43207]